MGGHRTASHLHFPTPHSFCSLDALRNSFRLNLGEAFQKSIVLLSDWETSTLTSPQCFSQARWSTVNSCKEPAAEPVAGKKVLVSRFPITFRKGASDLNLLKATCLTELESKYHLHNSKARNY